MKLRMVDRICAYEPRRRIRGVKTVSLDNLKSGDHSLTWDGKDESGTKVEEAVYRFEVVAMGPTGDQVPAKAYTSAFVERITMNDGATTLIAGKQEIPLDSVVQVAEPETDE